MADDNVQLMTPEEIHWVGVRILTQVEKLNDGTETFKGVRSNLNFSHINLGENPQLEVEHVRSKRRAYIYVKTEVFPKRAILSPVEEEAFVKECKAKDVDPYFAGITIVNKAGVKDGEIVNHELASIPDKSKELQNMTWMPFKLLLIVARSQVKIWDERGVRDLEEDDLKGE